MLVELLEPPELALVLEDEELADAAEEPDVEELEDAAEEPEDPDVEVAADEPDDDDPAAPADPPEVAPLLVVELLLADAVLRLVTLVYKVLIFAEFVLTFVAAAVSEAFNVLREVATVVSKFFNLAREAVKLASNYYIEVIESFKLLITSSEKLTCVLPVVGFVVVVSVTVTFFDSLRMNYLFSLRYFVLFAMLVTLAVT